MNGEVEVTGKQLFL